MILDALFTLGQTRGCEPPKVHIVGLLPRIERTVAQLVVQMAKEKLASKKSETQEQCNLSIYFTASLVHIRTIMRLHSKLLKAFPNPEGVPVPHYICVAGPSAKHMVDYTARYFSLKLDGWTDHPWAHPPFEWVPLFPAKTETSLSVFIVTPPVSLPSSLDPTTMIFTVPTPSDIPQFPIWIFPALSPMDGTISPFTVPSQSKTDIHVVMTSQIAPPTLMFPVLTPTLIPVPRLRTVPATRSLILLTCLMHKISLPRMARELPLSLLSRYMALSVAAGAPPSICVSNGEGQQATCLPLTTFINDIFHDLKRRIIFRRLSDKNEPMGYVKGEPRNESMYPVLVFSPHPDDDVIGMSAMISLLSRQAGTEPHDVHVAYCVSGTRAVRDDMIQRNRFLLSLIGKDKNRLTESDITDEDNNEQKLYMAQMIRESEVTASMRVVRGNGAAITTHFLLMPFYDEPSRMPHLTTTDKTDNEEVKRVMSLLEEVKPKNIFIAGDMSDPHLTHFTSYMCIKTAIKQWLHMGREGYEPVGTGQITTLREEKEELYLPLNPLEHIFGSRLKQMECRPDEALLVHAVPEFDADLSTTLDPYNIALNSETVTRPLFHFYCSAWSECSIEKVSYFYLYNPEDSERKARSILEHESQRVPMFGGNDEREFWERARDGGRENVNRLRILGMLQGNDAQWAGWEAEAFQVGTKLA